MSDETTSQTPSGRNAYLGALRRLRGTFLMTGFFSAVINILMLTGPLYMLQVYDRVLGSGSIATLQGLFLIVVILYGFMGLYEFLRSRLLARAAIRLDLEVGPAAFRAWLRSGGQQAARMPAASPLPLTDLGAVRGFLSSPAMGSIFDVPWIPLYLGLLFLIHPWLGWLTLAGAAVVALVAVLARRFTRAPQEISGRIDGEARAFSEQGRRNAELIEAMGMERGVTHRWQQDHAHALAVGQGASNVSEVTSAFSKSFRMLLQSAMLTVGALLVLRHEMTAGMIIATSILSGRALAPVDQIIAQWRIIGAASLAHKRLTAFFETAPRTNRPVALPLPTGQVSANRLTCLGHAPAPGAERPRMLNQVSFALEPGDGLGVIGNSAAGKSTLARLIVGAWKPDAGDIRFDGATRDQWDTEVLGRAIGYLPQTVELLPGTIRDNITRFDPDALDSDMIAAARLAGVHDMILALPEGYGTQVGMPGQPLSGGQVQRLGLARAVFGKPRLIVLDEPNSNLDAAGEAALAQAIHALRAGGATVILMTHRTSALAEVNKIMLLSAGNVVKFGDRDEVLRGLLLRPVPDVAKEGEGGSAPRPLPGFSAGGQQ
ncbi:type I secretion system permease/ATPase [Haematobacter massiliensis]|uniref:type I secretion system permease/ATPase n=1 Tax=Haematobacter massiliensis TaxID=195105 RepID=UPI0023F350B2|nr:type I secretion system permease/ATPase [Haematobacter massiliensis]